MLTLNKTKILILIITSVNSVKHTKCVRTRTCIRAISMRLQTWLLNVQILEEQPNLTNSKIPRTTITNEN